MHRQFILFLMCFLFLGTATILAETEEEILKSRESWVKIVDVEGRSLLVYAQNSPEWADLYMTENIKTNRRFGEAGCAVTALANATVNLIPMERLKAITEIMQSPVAFDSVKLARYFGRIDGRFIPKEDCDFVRYWPIILANFAEGNNRMHSHEAQGPAFYSLVFNHFGLSFKATGNIEETIEALKTGAMAITCSSGSNSPFSRIGHFFVLCAADEESVYILDSFFRDEYPKDQRKILQILSPGLLKISYDNLKYLGIQTQYVVWPAENATQYTPEIWKGILEKSNAVLAKTQNEHLSVDYQMMQGGAL